MAVRWRVEHRMAVTGHLGPRGLTASSALGRVEPPHLRVKLVPLRPTGWSLSRQYAHRRLLSVRRPSERPAPRRADRSVTAGAKRRTACRTLHDPVPAGSSASSRPDDLEPARPDRGPCPPALSRGGREPVLLFSPCSGDATGEPGRDCDRGRKRAEFRIPIFGTEITMASTKAETGQGCRRARRGRTGLRPDRVRVCPAGVGRLLQHDRRHRSNRQLGCLRGESRRRIASCALGRINRPSPSCSSPRRPGCCWNARLAGTQLRWSGLSAIDMNVLFVRPIPLGADHHLGADVGAVRAVRLWQPQELEPLSAAAAPVPCAAVLGARDKDRPWRDVVVVILSAAASWPGSIVQGDCLPARPVVRIVSRAVNQNDQVSFRISGACILVMHGGWSAFLAMLQKVLPRCVAGPGGAQECASPGWAFPGPSSLAGRARQSTIRAGWIVCLIPAG